jgi:hypothetical protein
MTGFYEHGTESSVSVNYEEFIELNYYRLLQK